MSEPASMKAVLLVEDDAMLRRSLDTALVANGYKVLLAEKIAMGWHLFTSEKPDIAVLDIALPDGTGLDLCKKIREHKTHGRTPVIILTAKHEMETKAEGFAAGADQYLVKPIQPPELAMWVQALLRRVSYDKDEGDRIKAGDCEIDIKARLVIYKGQAFGFLTNKEFDLMYFLVKKRPQVLSHKYLLTNLWHTVIRDHVVNTHVNNLRNKLPPELAAKIQTVPGKGFRFME